MLVQLSRLPFELLCDRISVNCTGKFCLLHNSYSYSLRRLQPPTVAFVLIRYRLLVFTAAHRTTLCCYPTIHHQILYCSARYFRLPLFRSCQKNLNITIQLSAQSIVYRHTLIVVVTKAGSNRIIVSRLLNNKLHHCQVAYNYNNTCTLHKKLHNLIIRYCYLHFSLAT